MTQGSNAQTIQALKKELDAIYDEIMQSDYAISQSEYSEAAELLGALAASDESFYSELAKYNKHSHEKVRMLAARAAAELAKQQPQAQVNNLQDFDNLYAQFESGDLSDVELTEEDRKIVNMVPTPEEKERQEQEAIRQFREREAAKSPKPARAPVQAPAPQAAPVPQPARAQQPAPAPQAVAAPRVEKPRVLSEEEKRNARHMPYLERFVDEYARIKNSPIYTKRELLAGMEKSLKEYMTDKSDVIREKAIEVWNEIASRYFLGTKVEFKPSQPTQSTPNVVSPSSADEVEKLYNEQRKPKVTGAKSISQFAKRVKKNVVSTFAQNPERKMQVKALQELANKAAQGGQGLLEYYCALHAIRKEIGKENNRLPSALEDVCKQLMAKVESNPKQFKEITEKYNLPENSGMNVKHMHAIAKEALDNTNAYKNDKPKKKPRT